MYILTMSMGDCYAVQSGVDACACDRSLNWQRFLTHSKPSLKRAFFYSLVKVKKKTPTRSIHVVIGLHIQLVSLNANWCCVNIQIVRCIMMILLWVLDYLRRISDLISSVKTIRWCEEADTGPRASLRFIHDHAVRPMFAHLKIASSPCRPMTP